MTRLATIELEAGSVPDLAAFMKQLRADAQRLNVEVKTRVVGTRVIIETTAEAIDQLFEPGWRG